MLSVFIWPSTHISLAMKGSYHSRSSWSLASMQVWCTRSSPLPFWRFWSPCRHQNSTCLPLDRWSSDSTCHLSHSRCRRWSLHCATRSGLRWASASTRGCSCPRRLVCSSRRAWMAFRHPKTWTSHRPPWGYSFPPFGAGQIHTDHQSPQGTCVAPLRTTECLWCSESLEDACEACRTDWQWPIEFQIDLALPCSESEASCSSRRYRLSLWGHPPSCWRLQELLLSLGRQSLANHWTISVWRSIS